MFTIMQYFFAQHTYLTRNKHTVLCISLDVTLLLQEVVQRLFSDQEDEQSTKVTDKDPKTQAEQLPVQATTVRNILKFKPNRELY